MDFLYSSTISAPSVVSPTNPYPLPMRPFIQPTAGATFFLGIPHTLMFRKDYVEFISKLENGFYGVVNLVLNGKDDLLLFTDWGDFFKRISNHEDPDKLMRMLKKPCPLVVDLMTGKSGYSLVRNRSSGLMRVGCLLPLTDDLPLLSIPGDSRTMEKALDLLDYSLRLYREIYDHCPFPGWKKGLQEVF